ncbi:MAG: FkbM family methyltransferase [Flavobacteriaceae bacterium]
MKKILKNLFSAFGFSVSNIKKSKSNIVDVIREYGLQYKHNINLLCDSFNYIKRFEMYGLHFTIEKENSDNLIIGLNNFRFQVESVEDIFIISEVFINKDYNFLNPDDVVLIDVGLNIGISSVFFSKKNNVKHIYAYEPVPYTFKIASKNIEMNKVDNITTFNFGLGSSNRKDYFYFNPDYKGNVGIRKNNSYSINKLAENAKKKIEVEIKDIGEVIDLVRKQHPNLDIIMKIDCEGGEYEIINRLDTLNLLTKVKLFMIEWHDLGAHPIETILLKEGFELISKNSETNSGMIYAIKNI